MNQNNTDLSPSTGGEKGGSNSPSLGGKGEALAKRVAWIAAGFSLLVCFLLIFNFVLTNSVNPVESATMKALVERLKQNPQDQNLVAEIRAFDLMARKAYFTSRWQLRTGGYLLLLGILVTLLAVRYIQSHKPKLEALEGIEKDPVLDTLKAQKWIMYVGGGVFVLAIVSGVLAYNALDEYPLNGAVAANEQTITTSEQPQAVSTPENENTSTPETAPVQENQTITSAENNTAEKPAEATTTQSTPSENKTETPATVQTPATAANTKANYPFFRGEGSNGVSSQKNVPVKWDGAAGTNVLWKVKTPKQGYSSPIVWGNKVFLTGADNAAREVYCFDLVTGNLLWTAKADNIAGSPAQMPKTTADTGLAAPTMATNGTAVFAIFASGDVIALDLNGNRLWAKNLGVPDNHYGHSSSLIIYKDKLLIQYDTNKNGKLIALSTANGNEVWVTQRKTKISWSSPILVNTGSRMELILTTNPNVDAYNPETGEQLWSIACLSGEVGPSAAYGNGLVFAANEYATFAAIKPGASPQIVWQADEYLPEAASPLAVNDLVFIATSYGAVACYESVSGTKLWEKEYGNGFYASPVYAGGNIYMVDMAGICHIFKADKTMQHVADCPLGEKSVCAPVFTEGKLLIRGFNNLYCIGN